MLHIHKAVWASLARYARSLLWLVGRVMLACGVVQCSVVGQVRAVCFLGGWPIYYTNSYSLTKRFACANAHRSSSTAYGAICLWISYTYWKIWHPPGFVVISLIYCGFIISTSDLLETLMTWLVLVQLICHKYLLQNDLQQYSATACVSTGYQVLLKYCSPSTCSFFYNLLPLWYLQQFC